MGDRRHVFNVGDFQPATIQGPHGRFAPRTRTHHPHLDILDTVFLRRIHELLGRAQDGAIWAIVSGEFPDGFERQMAEYGLKLDGRCQTNRGRPLPLPVCPLVRAAPPG